MATAIAIAVLTVGYVLVLRRSLLVGCVAFLFIACCFGTHFLHFKVATFTLTLDRLAFLGLIGAYVLQRSSNRVDRKPVGAADVALIVLLAVLALSMFTADWRTPGPGDAKPWWHLYAGYVLPAVVYWIARQSRLSEAAVDTTVGALAVFGVYVVAIGVLEVSGQWWLVFPRYIADPNQTLGLGCARGPMLHPVSFGLYVTVAMLGGYLWAVRRRERTRWLAYGCLPVFLAGLFFTYERSVWVGTWLGLIVVGALTLPRRWRTLVLAVVVVASVLFVATHWNSLLAFQRGNESAADTRRSALLRLSLGYVSWHMFLDHPWIGVHFGHFSAAKLPYLLDRSTTLDLKGIRHLCSHNVFLSLLTETGVIGLGLFLTLLLCWVHAAWRLWRDPRAPDWCRTQAALLLGALAVYTGCWPFSDLTFAPIDHGLLFLLAGIAVGLQQRQEVMNATAAFQSR
jgi:O-antigen ligase